MNWQKYKWSIVVITIVLTLTVLGGSHFFWQQYALDKPLTQVIETIDGVETLTLDNNDKYQSTQNIHITLNNVKNLQKTYQKINDSITNILGTKKYKLIIHDHRTPELEQLYYSMHYYIQEAIFTGKFSVMAEIIQEKALGANTKAQVYVDASSIYVQLMSNNGTLYMIIPRQFASTEVK